MIHQRVNDRKVAAASFFVILVFACLLFVWRNRSELRGLPSESPQAVSRAVAEESRSGLALERTATLARHESLHDPELKSEMQLRVRRAFNELYATDFDEVLAWRKEWGPGLREWKEEERDNVQMRLQRRRDRLESLDLDWENSRFFWVRRNGIRVSVVALRGFRASIWDIEHQESHGVPDRAVVSGDSDVIAVTVPVLYPRQVDSDERTKGFVVMWLSNGTMSREWQVFSMGFAAPPDSRAASELAGYRPVVK